MNTLSDLHVEGFFDPATWTVSYIVLDKATKQCALIDSVLDYDPKSGRTAQASADLLIARVRELGATVQWILETHVHADHLSAAPYRSTNSAGNSASGSTSPRCKRCSAASSTPAATSRATAASSITCLATARPSASVA
jgi:hypothetical protein